jgi:hypothetical protein
VDVGNVATLVVTDYVLPSVAFFTENGRAVVVWKAADALDGRRLFLVDGALQRRRAVGEGEGRRSTKRRDRGELRISMRLERRDVCHDTPDARERMWCGVVVSQLRLFLVWIA